MKRLLLIAALTLSGCGVPQNHLDACTLAEASATLTRLRIKDPEVRACVLDFTVYYADDWREDGADTPEGVRHEVIHLLGRCDGGGYDPDHESERFDLVLDMEDDKCWR